MLIKSTLKYKVNEILVFKKIVLNFFNIAGNAYTIG